MHPINRQPDFLAWLPKLMAVVAVLPFIACLGWLTYITAAASVERSTYWKLVPARVADPADGGNVRFEYTENGQVREVLIARSNGLNGVSVGEVIPLHINPANTAKAEPARGSDLWTTPGLLAFFLLFLVGCFLFLWRVKPMRLEIPEELLAMGGATKQDDFAPPSSRFARGMPGRSELRELTLRQPAQAWKANLFWSILPGGLAVAGLGMLMESGWMGVPLLLAGLAGVAWLIRQALRNASYVLRCDSRSISVSDRFGSRTVALGDIAEVRRGADLQCHDSAGRILLRLSGALEPPEALAELLGRIESHRRR
jgi:hypothetical protein